MRIIRELTYLGTPRSVLTGWGMRAVQGVRSFGAGGSITERILAYEEDEDGTNPPPATDDDLARMTCVEVEL